MLKDKFKELVKPDLENQTLFQLNQLKSFVDASIYQSACTKFESEEEKVKHLLDTLFNIRDFILTATSNNTLRINLSNAFNSLEASNDLGNSTPEQEKSSLTQTDEKLEQNQDQLENGEEQFESTANG